MAASVEHLERAVQALASLVRQDYPEGLSLAEIAATWGDGLTKADVAALAVVERQLEREALPGVVDDLAQRR